MEWWNIYFLVNRYLVSWSAIYQAYAKPIRYRFSHILVYSTQKCNVLSTNMKRKMASRSRWRSFFTSLCLLLVKLSLFPAFRFVEGHYLCFLSSLSLDSFFHSLTSYPVPFVFFISFRQSYSYNFRKASIMTTDALKQGKLNQIIRLLILPARSDYSQVEVGTHTCFTHKDIIAW